MLCLFKRDGEVITMLQKEHVTYLIQPCDKYPNHKISINQWITDKNEISNMFRKFVRIQEEREKAYFIDFDISMPNGYWIPKSQCEIKKQVDGDIFKF